MAKRKRKAPGTSPGTLVFTGNQKMEEPNITLCRYNEEDLFIDNPKIIDFLAQKEGFNTWYDVRGLHEVQIIERLGEIFALHPLVMEDMLDVTHIAKCEEYDNGIFFVVLAVSFNPKNKKIETEQVSIFIGDNFTISCQEAETELFKSIMERLNNKQSRLRKRKSDYLLYAMIDVVLDNYFIVLDKIEEEIDNLQDRVVFLAEHEDNSGIFHLKREVLRLRRIIIPLREAIVSFKKIDESFLEESTQPYIDDLVDHIQRCFDAVEGHRDMLNELHSLYLSEINHKMNSVMKLLTIISSIFIPLSFIVGLYGMNFEYMPELKYRYGYLSVLFFISLVAFCMVIYFKRKKWW